MAGGEASTGAGARAWQEAEVDAGFEFAFNNEAFSDKVLQIEVFGTKEDALGSGADAVSRKRRREEAQGDDGEGINSSPNVFCTQILRVNTIKVNSAILAAKSPFFFKLFSNGMKESDQIHATLRIADSEENAFMELLHFMYSEKLTPTTDPTLLLDILMASDKFEVISCMKLCGQRLIDLPMTTESAVLCLELPSSISVPAALTEAAKKFLAERYKEFLSTKFQDELMRIPLAGIVAVLSRNRLKIASEEAVYDFVLRWADSQYPNPEERRRILSSCLLPLAPLVRSKINDVPINQPSCIVDFTLKREQCSGLSPSGLIRSPPFYCAGHGFFLSAHRSMEPVNVFGLAIRKLEDKGLVRRAMDYKFEIKRRSTLEFVTIYMHTANTDSMENVGFTVHWSQFNRSCFINDSLHLRVHMKIKPQP
ncbi:BTB/POZ domain-containing protein POB1-like [Lolium perenne]|uniref:BTB/POZ domain-containing protein POB1-like n=1 Tax=Lolium perenne TaxID=4522 RepID=UPI0021F61086|nr:BTB/POZ domain-containing protein At2g46260-like [Lolium perenne]